LITGISWVQIGISTLIVEKGVFISNGGAGAFFSESLFVSKNSCKILIYKPKSRKRNLTKYASLAGKVSGISIIWGSIV
jgi:hypothetical protein